MFERPLNICYVAADYPFVATTSDGVGGIATHTSTLAQAVASLGHRVVILTQASMGPHYFTDGPVSVHALPAGPLRVWYMGRWLPVAWIRRSLAVYWALRKLQRDYRFDLVSFPDGAGEGFFYSLRPKTAFAVQLFGPGCLVQRWDGRRIPRPRARAEFHFERLPASRAPLLFSASQQFANEITKLWALPPERVRIVRNPLNVGLFRPLPQMRSGSGKIVLFVGHLQRLKGLLTLVAAIPRVARDHPDAHFVLIGNDTNSAPDGTSMRRFLTRELQRQGSAGYVTFLAPLSQPALVPYYQQCSVFVLPSLRDVYPNCLLEAMGCGRPCITTHGVGASELIVNGESGFVVTPNDANLLGEAISTVLSMPCSRQHEMGMRARAIVERVCEPTVIASETVKAYVDVLSGRFPPNS
jgi:glycosyltransferase involved in cell wall biosynthesis